MGWVDPLGLAAFALPLIPLAIDGIGTVLGGLLGAGSILGMVSISGDTPKTPPVPWPKKKNGVWVCICRAQGRNCDGKMEFGFGEGIGKSVTDAKAIAVKGAASN